MTGRIPEDHFTNTVEDAASYEAWRGEQEWIDDRPTAAELAHDDRLSDLDYTDGYDQEVDL